MQAVGQSMHPSTSIEAIQHSNLIYSRRHYAFVKELKHKTLWPLLWCNR